MDILKFKKNAIWLNKRIIPIDSIIGIEHGFDEEEKSYQVHVYTTAFNELNIKFPEEEKNKYYVCLLILAQLFELEILDDQAISDKLKLLDDESLLHIKKLIT